MALVVGVDLGGAAHAPCVLDRESAAVADHFEARDDAAGLRELARRLACRGAPTDLPVAIDRPSRLFVDALVAAGHPVVRIHPDAVKAARPGYRSSGAKDDHGDAYLLADLLRTDGFRPLAPVSDAICRSLRALICGRDDVVATRDALANQIKSPLDYFWPGDAAIFADLVISIALAFLERDPTPARAARLGARPLAAFLVQHRYRGPKSSEVVLARLRAASQGLSGPGEAEAKGEKVRARVAVHVSVRPAASAPVALAPAGQ